MTIPLKQIIQAIEEANEVFTSFWDTKTGKTVYLAYAIRGKGAFRRFKQSVRYHGLEQRWYDYLAEAYRELAIRWCAEKGLEYTE